MCCLLVIYFLGITASVASPEKTKIVIHTDGYYPPFSYLDGKTLKGFYVDLITKIDERLVDYDIELVPDKWSVARDKLKDGNGFAILGSYFHGHTQPYLYPYSIPLHEEEVVLVCGSTNDDNIGLSVSEQTSVTTNAQWPKDFKGKLVGNIKGYDGWLRNAVRSAENLAYVRFLEIPNIETALAMIVKGSLDCALFERFAFHKAKKLLVASGRFDPQTDIHPVISASIAQENAYLAYSSKAFESELYPFSRDFKRAFDIALFELQQSGDLEALTKRYGSLDIH